MLPQWSDDELERFRVEAIRRFIEQRLAEGADSYRRVFDECRAWVEELLARTNRLLTVEYEILRKHPRLVDALRYACAPPISADDLETISVGLLAMSGERDQDIRDPFVAKVRFLLGKLDRYRFPWVFEQREPTDAEYQAAVLATASLWCVQRVATSRRTDASLAQQQAVEQLLRQLGYQLVTAREFVVPWSELKERQYSREAKLGKDRHKADFVIRPTYDTVVAVECKVSNSETNSIKRLNDVINKARSWKESFGAQVVCVAIIGGVFKIGDLKRAQQSGVRLIFDHDLAPLERFLRANSSG